MTFPTSIRFTFGIIESVLPFPKARNPSYKVTVNFGNEVLQTSAQLPITYPNPEALIHKAILGVTNFPKKNIAGFRSEFLMVGCPSQDHHVHLVNTRLSDSTRITPGLRLCGWESKTDSKEISFEDFTKVGIRCGRIGAILKDRNAFELTIDPSGQTTILAQLPLPLDFSLLEKENIPLLNTLALFFYSNETSQHHVLAYSLHEGSCIPLGIDKDEGAVTGGHLY